MTDAKLCDVCGRMAANEEGWYMSIPPCTKGAPNHVCPLCMLLIHKLKKELEKREDK